MYLEDIALDEAHARFWSGARARGRARAACGRERAGRRRARPGDRRGRSLRASASRTITPRRWTAIAVRAEDTLGASETTPFALQVGNAGDLGRHRRSAARRTRTRSSWPSTSRTRAATSLEILASVAPWQHVRPMGEDLVATELVLPENHSTDARSILARWRRPATPSLAVRRKPRVAILPTGSRARRSRAHHSSRATSSTSTRWCWPGRCANGAATRPASRSRPTSAS